MSQSPMTDRLVRLACTERTVLVIPPDDAQPFPVPQMPMSHLVWLDHLSDVFLKKHARCLCTALMLDLPLRSWGFPAVPTQRCNTDGVRWTWKPEDFEGREPSMLVGGSYQSAVLRDLSEAVSLVPPTDGIHLIGVKAPKPGVHAFVHCGGQTMAIDPKNLLVDDVVAALDANAERLVLE